MNPSFHRLYHLIGFGIGLGLRPINSSGGLVDCLHGDECDGSSRLVAKGTPLWGLMSAISERLTHCQGTGTRGSGCSVMGNPQNAP